MRILIFIVSLFMLLAACGRVEVEHVPVNFLILLLDTTRADHIHCYGYERDTTPTIDSLAGAGTMWLNVQGQSSWTLPSMASIFTGLTERQHLAGIRDDKQYSLHRGLTTLPELFSEAGYQTAGFYTVPVMGEGYGFDQGMDYCDMEGCSSLEPAEVMTGKFLYWADSIRTPSIPYFAVLHLFDPHYRYDPPEPWDSRWGTVDEGAKTWASGSASRMIDAWFSSEITDEELAGMRDLYDGEIAYMDSVLSVFLSDMRYRGLLENTVILVVADHGEEFADHGGVTHGVQLHREITGIPLLVSGPGIPSGEVRTSLAGHVDVLPTLAAIAGLKVPDAAAGIDLLGREPLEPRILPASGYYAGVNDYIVVRRDYLKLFWNTEDCSAFMFDLENDPEESDTLPPDSSLILAAEYYWATPGEVAPEPMKDMEDRVEMFSDLGYLR